MDLFAFGSMKAISPSHVLDGVVLIGTVFKYERNWSNISTSHWLECSGTTLWFVFAFIKCINIY